MPMFSIPVNRTFVPEGPPSAPEGFVRLRQPLDRGLPATLQLDPELSLAIYVPTGDAVLWRDARPEEIVATAADETSARAAGSDDPVARAPIRLVLQRARQNVAAI